MLISSFPAPSKFGMSSFTQRKSSEISFHNEFTITSIISFFLLYHSIPIIFLSSFGWCECFVLCVATIFFHHSLHSLSLMCIVLFRVLHDIGVCGLMLFFFYLNLSAHILLKLTGKDVRQFAHCRVRDSLADLLVDLVAHLVGRIVDVAGDAAADAATAGTTTRQVELGHIFYIIFVFGLSIVVCVVVGLGQFRVVVGGRMIRYTIIQLIQ